MAGFWPDKGEQHRSTMRNSEYLSIRSEGMCPGHQPPRTYLRNRRLEAPLPVVTAHWAGSCREGNVLPVHRAGGWRVLLPGG